MNKSNLSIEQHVCPVCSIAFDTGGLLFDRRLRSNMDIYTATGYELCPEHLKLFKRGFIALVGCDPERSNVTEGTNQLNSEQVHRTGDLAHIRRELYPELFDVPVADNEPMVFVNQTIIDQLRSMSES